MTGGSTPPRRRGRGALHVALAATLMLTACSAENMGNGTDLPGTREGQGRIGPDDGRDPCRRELVQLDTAGVFFTTSIIAAAGGLAAGIMGRRPGIIGGIAAMSIAVGTAAAGGYFAQRRREAQNEEQLNETVASDLDRENQGLDRTQEAFERLVDCRARQMQQVRQQEREGAINAETARERLGIIRSYAEQDIRVSRSIEQDIARRGNDFDTAIESLAPEVRQAAAAAPRTAIPARPQRPVALRVVPQPNATTVAELPPSQPVQLRPAPREGFVTVETPQGQPLGFAPAAEFAVAAPAQMRALAVPAVAAPPPPAGASPAAQQVRFLAATNLAKRDNFRESIREAEAVLVRGGFEAGT